LGARLLCARLLLLSECRCMETYIIAPGEATAAASRLLLYDSWLLLWCLAACYAAAAVCAFRLYLGQPIQQQCARIAVNSKVAAVHVRVFEVFRRISMYILDHHCTVYTLYSTRDRLVVRADRPSSF